MGIHDLLPFLRKAGAVSSPVWSAVPQGARAAVDVPIFMHKFLYSERAFEGIALRFVRLAETIQSRGLQPTFVFDGPKLHLKGEERKRRAAAANAQMERFRLKRSAQVEKAMEHPEEYFMVALESPVNEGPLWPTSKDYDDLWHSLKAHGLDVSRAKHEAEALCAHLVLTGDAWCSITEDTDSVAFGCPRTIFKFLAPEPELVEAHTVYAKLKLSSEALLDFCMMCGSDFTDRIHLVGPVKALGLMQKWGSWSGVYENCRPGWSGKTADSADVFRDVYPVMQDMFASCCYESRAEPDKKDGVAPLPTDASGGVDATAGPQWEAGHAEASNSFHDEVQECAERVEAADAESSPRNFDTDTAAGDLFAEVAVAGHLVAEDTAAGDLVAEVAAAEDSHGDAEPAAKRVCLGPLACDSPRSRRGSTTGV